MRSLFVITSTAIISAFAFAGVAQADVTSVSGGAFGEYVNASPNGGGHVFSGPAPTVTLPPSGGGPFTATAPSTCVPQGSCEFLTTGPLAVSTQGSTGASGGSRSSASAQDVDALMRTSSEFKASSVSSSCQVSSDSASAQTTIIGGTFGGQPLPTNPPPNTTLTVHGATLVLNQQTTSGGPGNFTITVNAVHLTRSNDPRSGGIIVAQSRCGEQGPDVTVPFAPIGILGASALAGALLVVRQRRRSRGGEGPTAAGS